MIRLIRCMRTEYLLGRQAAKEYDTHLQAGANIAGFLKVADAMLAQGFV
jgi:glutamate dehydrogenase/leucine dehydrogenase